MFRFPYNEFYYGVGTAHYTSMFRFSYNEFQYGGGSGPNNSQFPSSFHPTATKVHRHLITVTLQ